ncbi:MAG: hypothetical protein NTX12_04305 [Actinobacteria bacterium]|nr:hypothetical protein [Actinomycetota bacterium]
MDRKRETEQKFPPVDTNKGQMMLIYLPEGSVIVDRSNVAVGGMLTEEFGKETPREIFNREALNQDSINREEINRESLNQSIRYEVPANAPRDFRRPEQIVLHRRVRRDWSHIANVSFAIYVTIASLVPLLLSTILGISVFNAHSNLGNGAIAQGDLMISHKMQADRIAASDIVLLRDANNWRLNVRQVVDVTTLSGATTISTSSGSNAALTEVFTLPNNSDVRFVTSRVPMLGFVSMFVNSLALKILGAVTIVLINIYAFYRRRRPHPGEGQKMVLVSR